VVDGDRLRQVLVILVDNALRHGHQGGTVRVRFDRAGQEMRLEVSDSGPGIPAEQKDKVFERFYQLDASRSGSGAGLGLAIARWIVIAHGGTIKLTDNEPGLMVRITIPIRNSRDDAARSTPHRETSATGVARGTDRPWWRAVSRR
jgi:two-component system, OmpR family, sensor kinase